MERKWISSQRGSGIIDVLMGMGIVAVVGMGIAYTTTTLTRSSSKAAAAGDIDAILATAQQTITSLGSNDLILPPYVPLSTTSDAQRVATEYKTQLPARVLEFASADYQVDLTPTPTGSYTLNATPTPVPKMLSEGAGQAIIGIGATPVLRNSRLLINAVSVIESMFNSTMATDNNFCTQGRDIKHLVYQNNPPSNLLSLKMYIQPFDLNSNSVPDYAGGVASALDGKLCPSMGTYLASAPRRTLPKPAVGFTQPSNNSAVEGYLIAGNSDLA
jgi:hypothetical protein